MKRKGRTGVARGSSRTLVRGIVVGLAILGSAWTPVGAASMMAPGRTPSRLIVTNSGFSAQVSGTTHNLRGVACPQANVCYAVGDQGTIAATTNGGRTWRVQNNPLRGLVDLHAVVCTGVSTCYIAGGYTVAQAGPDGWTPPAEGALLATTNGGRTWMVQRSHRGYTLLNSVACVSSRSCLVAGDRGTLLATTTGGRVWWPQSSATSRELYSITCPTARHCYAVGVGGATAVTTDGGSTWSSVPSGSLADLRGVACPSAQMCVAVGQNGTIVRTTDGGQTYNAAATAFATLYAKPAFYGVSCPTARICYSVGLGTVIAATADGGQTWSALTPNTAAILFGVSCPRANICYAVGGSGTILKTTAIHPGAGAPAAASVPGGSGRGTGGSSTGASAVTIDSLMVATAAQSDAAILHPTDTATIRAWYHSTPSGATGIAGRLVLLENGQSIGSYALHPTTAPDGTPVFATTISMTGIKPGLLTFQVTLQAGSVTAVHSMLITLLYD